MVEEKICTGCGLPKPLEEFSPRRDRPAGRKSRCKACLAAGAGASRNADPEKAREALRRSRAAAPSSRKRANSKTARRWRKANPEKVAASKRRACAKLKARVFAHYGTACACCGATENLSIDHVNGDGGDHREELFGRRNGGGEQVWRWLVKNGFPDGFQTLCIPCNQSKRTGERCRLDHSCDVDPEFAETTSSATTANPATA
jgi:hypothetical protein